MTDKYNFVTNCKHVRRPTGSVAQRLQATSVRDISTRHPMNTWKISHRLMAGFGLVIVALLGMSIYSMLIAERE